MRRDGRPDDPAFGATEALYRRCHPEHLHEYEQGKFRVIPTAWSELHNMSVVRGKYARPDHARWDSATDPENPPGFQPKLWRDCYVVRVAVIDVPPTIPSSGGVAYAFVPTHAPFEDLYSHSEIRASRDGDRILKQNKFKSPEVKAQYRGALSNKAVVVLRPGQIEIETAGTAGGA